MVTNNQNIPPRTTAARLGEQLTLLWTAILSPEPATSQSSDKSTVPPPPAPVVWLLGKVQSGKSSIVRALTRSTAAEVGSGFRPCTKTAQIYDFPGTSPILRFLDTRGLGEVDYDPADDIAFAEGQAHLMLVVMRALDQNQEQVIRVVREVRLRKPDWPIVVAQTTLHEGYDPGKGHVLPYPFDTASVPGAELRHSPQVPANLQRALARQRNLFATAGGTGVTSFVPIDFTMDGDGFEPRDYGLEALETALSKAAPEALASAIALIGEHDSHAAEAHSHILGYAIAAAAADVVPVAGAIAVPGVQAKLLHSIARIYGATWDRQTLAEFGGCLGSSIVTRILASFGIRQVAKLVPAYGQTIGAAAAAATSFATTYALGKAACYFLSRRRAGGVDPAAVVRTYTQSLEAAFKMAKEQGFGGADGGKADR